MGIAEPSLEVCPDCGQYVDELDESTGWCYECSGTTPVDLPNRNKYLEWLTRNADEIERTMVDDGVTSSVAKRTVSNNNRPICLCCSRPIQRGIKTRDVFCSTTPECSKAQSVYNYHIRRRNYIYAVPNHTHEEAVKLALTAAKIVQLTGEL